MDIKGFSKVSVVQLVMYAKHFVLTPDKRIETYNYFRELFLQTVLEQGLYPVDGIVAVDIQETDEFTVPDQDDVTIFKVRCLCGKPDMASLKPPKPITLEGCSTFSVKAKPADAFAYRLFPEGCRDALRKEFEEEAAKQGYVLPLGTGSIVFNDLECGLMLSVDGLEVEMTAPVKRANG